jgi:importin subunit beta-1
VDYVATLREGILEAYTGITSGFKNTDKGMIIVLRPLFSYLNMHIANLLLQHVPSILDLIQRCLKDDDRTDATMRLSYGLIGDLAASFPRGEIKNLLLSHWIAGELRTKFKMPGETKKTLRWAREVSFQPLLCDLN